MFVSEPYDGLKKEEQGGWKETMGLCLYLGNNLLQFFCLFFFFFAIILFTYDSRQQSQRAALHHLLMESCSQVELQSST